MNTSIYHTALFSILVLLILATPLLFIDPVFFGVALPDAFNFPKRYLVQLSCLAIFILFSVHSLSARRVQIPWNRALLPYALFIACGLFSLLYSPSFHAGLRALNRWLCYAVILLAALSIRFGPRRLRIIALSAIASVTAASILALMQLRGMDPFSFRGGLHRLYSTLGNPNYFASLCAVVLPLGFWGWLVPHGHRKTEAACLAFSALAAAALLAIGSRGGLAALCAGITAAAVISRPRFSRIRLLILIVLIGAITASFLIPSPRDRGTPDTIQRFKELAGRPGNSLVWREMVWKVCLRMTRRHPFLGSGMGSFRLLYLHDLADLLNRPGSESYAAIAEWGIDYAHNDYLQILVELGLAGLILFVWFLCSVLAGLAGEARNGQGDRWFTGAALAALLVMLFHALVSFPFHLWSTSVVVFILAGVSLARRCGKKEFLLSSPSRKLIFGALAALVALFAAVSMTVTIASEIQCARGQEYLRQNRQPEALRHLARAVRLQPHNGRARFFLGLCLMNQRSYEEALGEMNAAERTYGRQPIHIEKARINAALGRRGDALRSIDTAVSMLPRDQKAWLLKGTILFKNGDLDGAVSCYRRSLSLKPDFFEAARNLAVAHDARGDAGEALKAYRTALRIGGPGAANLHVNMGAIEARRGNTDGARELWEKALSIDPENARAQKNMELLNRERNRAE